MGSEKAADEGSLRVIGQKELVKTAVTVGIPTVAAVISFFREDIRWTKRVGKNLEYR